MSDFDEIQTANVLDEREEITRLRAAYDAMEKMLRESRQHFMRVDMERIKLRAENEKLREALKPFAELAVAVEKQYENCLPSEKHLAGVGYKHLRAAAAAIREIGE